jgi:hypothetical protein
MNPTRRKKMAAAIGVVVVILIWGFGIAADGQDDVPPRAHAPAHSQAGPRD